MKKIPVLVVGHQCEELSLLRSLLEAEKVKVARAVGGGELLDTFCSYRFSFIVIDLNSLGQEAYRVAEQLRGKSVFRSIPLLFLTDATDNYNAFFKGHEFGVVDCLVGPVDKEKLANKTEIFLQHYLCSCSSLEKGTANDLLLELEVLYKELEEKNQQLEQLSAIDGVTGLFNRYYFENNLSREWRQASRERNIMSLLLICVDSYQEYRVHYGETAGDDCLCEIAGTLHQTLLRPVDTIARYGEDEFAVLLPETDTEGAERVAERMLSAVRKLAVPYQAPGAPAYVTISVGAATLLPQSKETSLSLVGEALKVLLLAKESGGNCLRVRR